MKITDIETVNLKIPVSDPITNRETHVSTVFTKIDTDEGIMGFSEVNASPTVKEFIDRDVAPKLKGKNPIMTESIWHELYQKLNSRAHTGIWSLGVSAIDVALWDIKGKYLKQPIYCLLGGSRQTVPAYITCGSGDPYEEYSPDQMADFFDIFVKEGHDKIKMQVARGRWPLLSKMPMTESLDYSRVSAVREKVGKEVKLSIDANCKLSLLDALRLARKLAPLDIYWFEEPVYRNDAKLLAQMRKLGPIPIAAGQNEGHKWKHLEFIINNAVDIVQPDVQHVGGFTEGLKVAHIAQAYNLPIATHASSFQNMHLVAGVDNGFGVEFHYATWKASEVIWKNWPKPMKGWITVPDRPGLGIYPNESKLSEFIV